MKRKSLLATSITILALTVNTMAQPVPAYVPTNGLVGWWGFNGNANDESGNGNNGTTTNVAVTTDRFGTANAAYSYNGINSRIDVANAFFDVGWPQFTISCWMNSNNANNSNNVNYSQPLINTVKHNGIAIGTMGSNNPFTNDYDDKYVVLAGTNPDVRNWDIIGDPGASNSHGESNGYQTLNQWNHVVLIKSSINFYLYINGVLDKTYPVAITAPSHLCKLVFGALDPAITPEVFSGKLDDYGVWNRALTQQEITALNQNCNISNPTSITVRGGSPKVCTGDTRIYTTGADTGVVFNWVVPTGVVINNGQGTHSINVTFTSNFSVSGDILVTKIKACGNSAATNLTVLRKVPSMPYYISIQGGSNGVCIGDARTYSTKPDTAVTFNWSVPAGAVINNGQGTNSIEVTFINNISANGAVISVVKVNSCGNTSAPRNLYIQRKLPFVPHSISTLGGSAKVCPGDVRIYNTSSTTAVSFYWTVPNGAVITNGQGTSSIHVMYNNNFIAGGEISVAGVNSCGIGSPRMLNVKRNLPVKPYAVLGASEVCPGSNETYTVQYPVYPNSYNWVVPTGATINSGQGTSSIQVTFNNSFNTNSIVSVEAVNTCGSSYPYYYIINKNMPAIPSAITGLNYGLCGGRDVVYSVQQVQGMTYNWTVPGLANITSGQGTNSITVNFQSVNFQKTITVTASNTCGTSVVRSLTIRSAPEKPGIISGPLSVCANSTGIAYSILPDTSATDYTWTGPTGSKISANGITSLNNMLTTTASSVSVDFGNITANSTIRVRANNNCGSSAQSSLLLTDCLYLPVCTATVVNNNTFCNSAYNGSAAVTANGGTSPYTYEWRNDNNEIVSNSEIASELPGGNYTVTVTDSFGSTSSCQTSIGGGSAFSLEKHWQYWSRFNTHCEPFCNGYIYVETESELSQSYSYLWNTGATTSSLTGLCGGDNEELVYTVTVTNEAGCQKSISYGIVNNPPMLIIGCQVDQNESYPGAGDGAIYVQSFGYADNSYNGLIDGLSAGTYNFSVTNSGTHCTKSCSCTIVTLNPRLEEDANSSVKKVSARPNPFSDVLKIEVATDEELIITINDVAGREMAVYPNINSSFIVDAKLNAGMYYIVAENKSGSYRKVFKVVRSN